MIKTEFTLRRWFKCWPKYKSDLKETWGVDFNWNWRDSFNVPIKIDPPWKRDVRLVYWAAGYDQFEEGSGYLTLKADYGTIDFKAPAARLETDNIFKRPLRFDVWAQLDRKSCFSQCPGWFLYDKGKVFSEIDPVEYDPKTQEIIFTYHKGLLGYDDPSHEIYTYRLYFPGAIKRFNLYSVLIEENKITWFVNNMKVFEVFVEVPDYDYKLIVSTNAHTWNKTEGIPVMPGKMKVKRISIKK